MPVATISLSKMKALTADAGGQTSHHPMNAATSPDLWSAVCATLRQLPLPSGSLPVSIKIKITSGGAVTLPMAPPAEPGLRHDEVPNLSAKQKKILVALLPGPMKGETLADAAGLANRSSLYSGRGMRQLTEWGLVVNDEATGYTLTESGEDLATEIEEA